MRIYINLSISEILLWLVLYKISAQYAPDWNSLDQRPLPKWYDDAKIGIFIHWGVFSVPSFRSEWFWWDWQGSNETDVIDFMKKNYPPGFTYADFAKSFTVEFFNPYQWADIFSTSGAKYVILTSKHHEGYCLWPSENSWNWNAKDVGPHRDLVGDLADAIRSKTSLKFGLYHSLFEWFNPLYRSDAAQSFKKQDFVKYKTLPELYDIVNRYKPEMIWSDGDWDVQDTYWNSTQFIAWLYNESPVKDTVVVNDRWGNNCLCKHGDVYTCSDNYNPKTLLKHKWENCMPLDQNSWGYRRNMVLSEVLTIEAVITSIVETISCGGNILINIGPTKEGTIPAIFEERLRQMGSWLSINGEAVYESRPWKHQNDSSNAYVWYTKNGNNVYGILLKYPADGKVQITSPQATEYTNISLLGYSGKLQWLVIPEQGIIIDLTSVDFKALGLKWSYVFKFTNVD